MVAVKVMVVRVATLGVPRLPTLKVPLAVAAAGLLGVPGWGLADEVPKPAHSQGLAQVIVLLLHVRTQRGLLQGHPDLRAQTASPKAPGPTKAPHPPQLQALGGGGEASSLRLQQPSLPVPRLGSASRAPRTWEERGQQIGSHRKTPRFSIPSAQPSPGTAGPRVCQKVPFSALGSLPHPRARQSPGEAGRRPRAAGSLRWPWPGGRLGSL